MVLSASSRILVLGSVAVLAGVLCQKLNITSRIRHLPWPKLVKSVDLVDNIAGNSPGDGTTGNQALNMINTELDNLLKRIKQTRNRTLGVKSRRTLDLVRSINQCDGVERECLVKILGIPGLSRTYYFMVLQQLAQHINVPFKESDVLMLKRMNGQPNFVDTPEVAYSNLTYPVFIKFNTDESKDDFIDRFESVLTEKMNPQYLSQKFNANLFLDKMPRTMKIQLHGFRTMTQTNLYQVIDRLSKQIGYGNWKDKIQTLYQTRYTKFFDFSGQEQLQTEGIIVKLRTRRLKFEWMRRTREEMVKRPKDQRKGGFSINLKNHVKYRHRNFTVYIDEHLSTHKKNLFLIARARCLLNNWLHCWTWDGQVYVRKTENASTIRINTFEDIDRCVKPNPIPALINRTVKIP
uniref:FP protein C-terminal domain-containing protein n=1 Tax=Cacopsylla melanoneura TaxID=428564 RepID=A0A8D9AAP3_9HEMI